MTARASVSESDATRAARGKSSLTANSPSPGLADWARAGSVRSEEMRSVITPVQNPGGSDGSRRFATATSFRRIANGRYRNFVLDSAALVAPMAR
jgi:hypothetical protein